MEDCVKNKLPRNKEGLSSKSGKVPKKKLPRKTVVEFQFTTPAGLKYKGKDGARIKVSEEGGVSCLIRREEDTKWWPIQAKIDWIKVKEVIIKRDPKKKKL